MVHARIAMTRPGHLNGRYLFELIDVDGPKRGRCLADIEVGGKKASESAWSPLGVIRREATAARAQLRAVGKQLGYTVSEY